MKFQHLAKERTRRSKRGSGEGVRLRKSGAGRGSIKTRAGCRRKTGEAARQRGSREEKRVRGRLLRAEWERGDRKKEIRRGRNRFRQTHKETETASFGEKTFHLREREKKERGKKKDRQGRIKLKQKKKEKVKEGALLGASGRLEGQNCGPFKEEKGSGGRPNDLENFLKAASRGEKGRRTATRRVRIAGAEGSRQEEKMSSVRGKKKNTTDPRPIREKGRTIKRGENSGEDGRAFGDLNKRKKN